MTFRLAKLADYKSMIGASETAHDDRFVAFIERASRKFEDECGHPVARLNGVVEYPYETPNRSPLVRVRRWPIESVTSIKQLHSEGLEADFTAGDALTENTDFIVSDPPAGNEANRGVIERVNDVWTLRSRFLQIQYAGGFIDPAAIDVTLATATWTAATKTLTQVGAFASYTFTAGDVIVITGGTGAKIGAYVIASRTSDDAIVLSKSLASGDLSTGDITSVSGQASTVIQTPAHVQNAVLLETRRLDVTADKAGITNVALGGAGGAISLGEQRTHESLIEAAQGYQVRL